MYKTQPYAVIENIFVDPHERRKGIANTLFSHIEKMCYKRQCSKIMLLSSSAREEAHQLFEKMVFSGSKKKGFVKYYASFNKN